MKQLFSLKFLWKVYAVLITISIILMRINPDLPMKEVILCLTILIVFRQDYTQLVSDQSKEQPSRTPHVNPKLGWLGLLGFLGFSGIPCYLLSGQTFPFLFFCFFGFFGFFFEGKLSDILRDERFCQNELRATANASHFCIQMIAFCVVISAQLNSSQFLSPFLMSSLGLCLGLVKFLQPYLLYRYDQLED